MTIKKTILTFKLLALMVITFSCFAVDAKAEPKQAEEQLELGLKYKFGQGVERDDEKAFLWIEKAAKQGDKNAELELGKLYVSRYQMDKALVWYEKSANQGVEEAEFIVAEIYNRGIRSGRNAEKARYWYEKAVSKGHELARYALADMYYNGIGGPQDYEKAFILYDKLAHEGAANAQVMLGTMYKSGLGTKQDNEKALFWIEKAANKGAKEAQILLAQMYYEGKDIQQDYKQAYILLSLSSSQDEDIKKLIDELKEILSPEDLHDAESQINEFRINRNREVQNLLDRANFKIK